jgi:hypothetical protein
MDMTKRILSVYVQEKGKSLFYLESTTFWNIGSFFIVSLSNASNFPCSFEKHRSARRLQGKSDTPSENVPKLRNLSQMNPLVHVCKHPILKCRIT